MAPQGPGALIVDPPSLRKAGADLQLAADALEGAGRDVGYLTFGDPHEIFGEYGAGEQYPAYRQAWLDEIQVYHDAVGQTSRAMVAAADRYQSTDGSLAQGMTH